MRPLGHQKKRRQRSPAATVQTFQKEDTFNTTNFCPSSSRRAEKVEVNVISSSARNSSEAPAMTAPAAFDAAFNLLSFSKAAGGAISGENSLPSPTAPAHRYHQQHLSTTSAPRIPRSLADSPPVVLIETGIQQYLRANQPTLEECWVEIWLFIAVA